jgi:uncharacterized membrane protein YhaH (DUF805 family)
MAKKSAAREWVRFYVFVCVWSAPIQAFLVARGFADQRHMADLAWHGHVLVAVFGLLSFVTTLALIEDQAGNKQ